MDHITMLSKYTLDIINGLNISLVEQQKLLQDEQEKFAAMQSKYLDLEEKLADAERKYSDLANKFTAEEAKHKLVENEVESLRMEIQSIQMRHLNVYQISNSMIRLIAPAARFVIMLPFIFYYRR